VVPVAPVYAAHRFVNPARPSEFVLRESIETRTLVVFDERA
jgi:hypothetical protein